ncbi:carboxymuconolactone decarboxylase family protein [Zhouia amylolytica]|uniref:carboxymuconolactone decarboxylase family protein n=1 Tax=Zhouia amylolytica TaxID=376730 RepID=UPI0020CF0DD8|nr:carboxymuconolactone decarboxylase family protein [Zhouia amylolytica]MCQ0111644.1 carboxymuconolactone decarboxylase family protein [Zhouia amylolytica]
MQRIDALNPEQTTGPSKDLFEAIQSKLGMVPNMMRTMGNSPAVLGGYLSLSESLGKSALGGKLGELIALTVANVNGCNYCNAAHSFIGEKLVGIDANTIENAKAGKGNDTKTQAALTFAQVLLAKRGSVSTEDFNAVKGAGYTDAEIAEIIGHTVLNIFTNYFNNAIEVVVDFPETALVETSTF